MAFFDKWFGKGRLAAQARAAELRGDLVRAGELFGEAGDTEQAARIMVVRGEAELDARARLLLFTQAASLAPEGTETNRTARLKRAELLLALAGDAVISAVARHEVTEAARDLDHRRAGAGGDDELARRERSVARALCGTCDAETVTAGSSSGYDR